MSVTTLSCTKTASWQGEVRCMLPKGCTHTLNSNPKCTTNRKCKGDPNLVVRLYESVVATRQQVSDARRGAVQATRRWQASCHRVIQHRLTTPALPHLTDRKALASTKGAPSKAMRERAVKLRNTIAELEVRGGHCSTCTNRTKTKWGCT